MALQIEVERSFSVDMQNPKEGDPVMGGYVHLREGEQGGIDIHQNEKKIAEVPDSKVEEVKDFKSLGAIISGIKGPDHLIISFLN